MMPVNPMMARSVATVVPLGLTPVRIWTAPEAMKQRTAHRLSEKQFTQCGWLADSNYAINTVYGNIA
jgi:hypothetical protein